MGILSTTDSEERPLSPPSSPTPAPAPVVHLVEPSSSDQPRGISNYLLFFSGPSCLLSVSSFNFKGISGPRQFNPVVSPSSYFVGNRLLPLSTSVPSSFRVVVSGSLCHHPTTANPTFTHLRSVDGSSTASTVGSPMVHDSEHGLSLACFTSDGPVLTQHSHVVLCKTSTPASLLAMSPPGFFSSGDSELLCSGGRGVVQLYGSRLFQPDYEEEEEEEGGEEDESSVLVSEYSPLCDVADVPLAIEFCEKTRSIYIGGSSYDSRRRLVCYHVSESALHRTDCYSPDTAKFGSFSDVSGLAVDRSSPGCFFSADVRFDEGVLYHWDLRDRLDRPAADVSPKPLHSSPCFVRCLHSLEEYEHVLMGGLSEGSVALWDTRKLAAKPFQMQFVGNGVVMSLAQIVTSPIDPNLIFISGTSDGYLCCLRYSHGRNVPLRVCWDFNWDSYSSSFSSCFESDDARSVLSMVTFPFPSDESFDASASSIEFVEPTVEEEDDDDDVVNRQPVDVTAIFFPVPEGRDTMFFLFDSLTEKLGEKGIVVDRSSLREIPDEDDLQAFKFVAQDPSGQLESIQEITMIGRRTAFLYLNWMPRFFARNEFVSEILVLRRFPDVDGYLGSGSYGDVYLRGLRSDREDFTPVAAKSLSVNPHTLQSLVSRLEMLSVIDHANVLKILGWSLSESSVKIVSKYCHHGSADKYLKGLRSELSTDDLLIETIRVLKETMRGIEAIHSHHLIHQDIKPSNILLCGGNFPDQKPAVKVADFGLLRPVESTVEQRTRGENPSLTCRAGTRRYMCPEDFVRRGVMVYRRDIYSFGITSYELLLDRLAPESGPPTDLNLREIRPRELTDLLRCCWTQKPLDRPPSSDVLKCLELVECMAQKDSELGSLKRRAQDEDIVVVSASLPLTRLKSEERNIIAELKRLESLQISFEEEESEGEASLSPVEVEVPDVSVVFEGGESVGRRKLISQLQLKLDVVKARVQRETACLEFKQRLLPYLSKQTHWISLRDATLFDPIFSEGDIWKMKFVVPVLFQSRILNAVTKAQKDVADFIGVSSADILVSHDRYFSLTREQSTLLKDAIERDHDRHRPRTRYVEEIRNETKKLPVGVLVLRLRCGVHVSLEEYPPCYCIDPADVEYTKGFGNLLGSGAYGRVRPASPPLRHLGTFSYSVNAGIGVVVKTLVVQDCSTLLSCEREFQMHVRLSGMKRVVFPFGAFLDEDLFVMVLEKCHEDWSQGFSKMGRLQSLWFLRQVSATMQRLHYEYGILHQDLKLENLLRSDHFVVKLTDFGLAKCIDDPDDGTVCGTVGYIPRTSPPIHWNEKDRLMYRDVFAFGVLCLEICCQRRKAPSQRMVDRFFQKGAHPSRDRVVMEWAFEEAECRIPGIRPVLEMTLGTPDSEFPENFHGFREISMALKGLLPNSSSLQTVYPLPSLLQDV